MVLKEKLNSTAALLAAALLFLASMIPLLTRQKASAYGLLPNREIKMSSSVNGSVTTDLVNNVIGGTDVAYNVKFDVATDTTNVGGIVVEFCSNSPIIQDSCTAPTGFTLDITGATTGDSTALALTQVQGISGFAVDTSNSTDNKLILTNGTPDNPAPGETYEFTLGTNASADDGITNPTNTNTTFYARIVTYDTAAHAQAYTSTALGTGNIDAGGAALSTAQQITITSKVQERLTFCVYTDGNGDTTLGDSNLTNCTVSGSAITLGDTNGVLYDTGPFVNNQARYNVSTNASNGVTIRAKGTTLTSGSFTIEPSGATPGDNTGQTSTTGDEQFGFCTFRDGASAAGLTPSAPYADSNCGSTTNSSGTGSTGGTGGASFAFDTSTSNDNLTTTYGDTIATKAAGALSTGVLAFVGNISTTTKPGIYTSTMTFIATGNY